MRRRRGGGTQNVDIASLQAFAGDLREESAHGPGAIEPIRPEVSLEALRRDWNEEMPNAIILRLVVEGDLRGGDVLELTLRVDGRRRRLRATVRAVMLLLGGSL